MTCNNIVNCGCTSLIITRSVFPTVCGWCAARMYKRDNRLNIGPFQRTCGLEPTKGNWPSFDFNYLSITDNPQAWLSFYWLALPVTQCPWHASESRSSTEPSELTDNSESNTSHQFPIQTRRVDFLGARYTSSGLRLLRVDPSVMGLI